jgi:thioredoxin 1
MPCAARCCWNSATTSAAFAAPPSPPSRALEDRPDVRHIKIADGRGRPLGRSFSVKLWPTLVFLQDGKEVERLVRPVDHHPVAKALRALADSPA